MMPLCIDRHLFVEYKCRAINFIMKNAITSRDGSGASAPVTLITHGCSWHNIFFGDA